MCGNLLYYFRHHTTLNLFTRRRLSLRNLIYFTKQPALFKKDTMINWGIIGATLLPNVGGWVGALTMTGEVKRPDGKAWYQLLNKPPWTPPNWLFGPMWTTLYCGMGYASYKVYQECGGFTDDSVYPLALYGTQLVLNWMWTPIFFKMHLIGLALCHMVVGDVAAVACTASFYAISPTAGYIMLPYLAWLSIATCLNYSIWQRNKNPKKSQ